jgi:exonuclease 3'-5' domain-containing protein 1
MTYLIDVHVLGTDAFTHRTPLGKNLKELLEAPSIPKVSFDVRNDSDALYSHYGISLAGVQDLQLMELATRNFSKRRVNGLAKCIEHDAPMTPAERRAWSVAKEKGRDLFAPDREGSYEVFNVCPLATEIIQYCTQDVHFLPKLWRKYDQKLSTRWAQRVEMEVLNRIQLSHSRNYNGKGQHMALAPKGWS